MKKKIESVSTTLEIDDDIDLHITGWFLQRVGWAVMLMFLTLAGLGFFGEGPMSERMIGGGEASLTYEGYLRRGGNTEIEILAPAVGGLVRVALSSDFNKTFRIEKISPEPAKQTLVNGSTLLDFPCTGQGQITVFLSVRKEEMGKAHSTVVVNENAFTLDGYIYP